jgi:hypothetical protein
LGYFTTIEDLGVFKNDRTDIRIFQTQHTPAGSCGRMACSGGGATFDLSDSAYGLNQLRYDLRKLKGHGLLQRDGSRYAYHLTPKGVQVALLFLFFHKRLCGPLANSRFHNRPDPHHQPASKLEAAYHRADNAIQQIVDLLAA